MSSGLSLWLQNALKLSWFCDQVASAESSLPGSDCTPSQSLIFSALRRVFYGRVYFEPSNRQLAYASRSGHAYYDLTPYPVSRTQYLTAGLSLSNQTWCFLEKLCFVKRRCDQAFSIFLSRSHSLEVRDWSGAATFLTEQGTGTVRAVYNGFFNFRRFHMYPSLSLRLQSSYEWRRLPDSHRLDKGTHRSGAHLDFALMLVEYWFPSFS